MQRQSLGSPGSKLHHAHGAVATGTNDEALAAEDPNRINRSDDDHDRKTQRPLRSVPPPDRLIHLVPVLTLFCFLVLYLCSHDPSQSDLANFNGLRRLPRNLDSAESEIGELGRFVEVNKGDILAMRSLRNLQEIGRSPNFRLHRKLGDF